MGAEKVFLWCWGLFFVEKEKIIRFIPITSEKKVNLRISASKFLGNIRRHHSTKFNNLSCHYSGNGLLKRTSLDH